MVPSVHEFPVEASANEVILCRIVTEIILEPIQQICNSKADTNNCGK